MADSVTEDAAREFARGFSLAAAGPDFVADPYPAYEALREHDPVHRLEATGYFAPDMNGSRLDGGHRDGHRGWGGLCFSRRSLRV